MERYLILNPSIFSEYCDVCQGRLVTDKYKLTLLGKLTCFDGE